MSTYQPASKSESDIPMVRWGVHWRTPAAMALLFVAGILFAIGHHIFYRSLDGTLVTSTSQQEWTIRIGTGLAFLAKAALTASIGVAFTQYFWTIARTEAMAVNSIDAMFSLTKNPLAFRNPEVIWRAKLLVLLALASWFMPLIATVTPGTISVESRSVTNTTNTRVPSVDFVRDETLWSDSMGAGLIVNASPAVTRLLSAVASSVGIIPITAPFPNSSFTLQFHAPALKCESLADAINNGQPVGNCDKCTSLQTLFNSTIDVAVNYYYWQAAKPDESRNLFFIRTGESRQGLGDFSSVSCQLWNASYTTQFTFTDGIQTTLIHDLVYESVVPFNHTVYFSQLPPGGRAYLATYLAVSDLLSGQVGLLPGTSSSGMAGINLSVTRTGLMACPEVLASWKARGSRDPPLDQVSLPWMCRNNSVAAAVEDLFQNFTLSLLSSALLSGNTTTDVQVSSPRNFWRYGPFALVVSYVAGVVVAFVALFVGGWALVANGYSADVSFSSILLTTRNPDLDGIAMGQCLGARPLDQNFGNTKLQFGVVGRTEGVDHVTFGVRGNVRELRKYQDCI